MFKKAWAQTKPYQNPTVIVIFIVCDQLCGPGVIRLFRIWLEVQEEIGWETAGHPPAWPSPQSPSPQLGVWDQNGSALTAALFEIYRKLLLQDKLEFGDVQKMSWYFTLKWCILPGFAEISWALLLVFSSVYLWIFIWLLQESLGPDVLTAEYSQKFWLDMHYLILFGVLNHWVLCCCCTPE